MAFVTKVIFNWGVRCFGMEHMKNLPVRAVRLAEEVVELAQSLGVRQETLHKLVDMVYSRPAGDPFQEVGGVLVTTHALCHSMGIEVKQALETEVHRCLSKSPEHFAKRNEEKLQLGMTG